MEIPRGKEAGQPSSCSIDNGQIDEELREELHVEGEGRWCRGKSRLSWRFEV